MHAHEPLVSKIRHKYEAAPTAALGFDTWSATAAPIDGPMVFTYIVLRKVDSQLICSLLIVLTSSKRFTLLLER